MLAESNAAIIGRMRLMLSAAALVVYIIDMPARVLSVQLTLATLGAYFLYSLACETIPRIRNWFTTHIRNAHWIDVFWYGLFIAVSDPNAGVLFLFFVFAILSASFRYGSAEGRKVTLVSVAIYILSAMVAMSANDIVLEWGRLVLRSVFLIALGFMTAKWGESELTLKKKLQLLRDVSQLSNPRFGTDQTVHSVLDKIKNFFEARSCLLLEQNTETKIFTLRETEDQQGKSSVISRKLPAEAAAAIMPFERHDIIAFVDPHPFRRFSRPRKPAGLLYDAEKERWIQTRNDAYRSVADALSTECYLSAPIPGTKLGRIYVTCGGRPYTPGDAVFLSQVTSYAFATIENIELLDRLATEAAHQERRKIGRDIHDSTIQPYIGLKLGLEALQKQASDDNPLKHEIERLVQMTADVIQDLQAMVSRIKGVDQSPESILLSNVERQVERFKNFYGIHIQLDASSELDLNDRLAAEVLHIVNEGLSNIRKHTTSNHGAVTLADHAGLLRVQIENQRKEAPATPFVPRSITERAIALGGRAWVDMNSADKTVINIEIPT